MNVVAQKRGPRNIGAGSAVLNAVFHGHDDEVGGGPNVRSLFLERAGTASNRSLGTLKRKRTTHTTIVRHRKINIGEEFYSVNH